VSKRPKPAQQGQPDGLCGLYALINFLHTWPDLGTTVSERQQEAFRYLFEAAEELNLLNAHYLHSGFEQHYLHAIFNRTAENIRLPFRALFLDEFKEGLGSIDDRELLSEVCQNGGCAVIPVGSDQHWVLAHKVKSRKICVDDSARTESYWISKPSSCQGLAIVEHPQSSQKLNNA
tara:strand:+ start:1152 stop:1679 length:528 start_codon:yes stop_codon:yes gene_type:complete